MAQAETHLSESASHLVTSVFQTLLLATTALLGLGIDIVALFRFGRYKRTAPWNVYAFLPSLLVVHIITNVALVPMEILVDMDVIYDVQRAPCLVFGIGHALLIFSGLVLRTGLAVSIHFAELCQATVQPSKRRTVCFVVFNVFAIVVASCTAIPLAWRDDLADNILPAFVCISPPANGSTHSVVRFTITSVCVVATLAVLWAVFATRMLRRVTTAADANIIKRTPILAGFVFFVLCYGMHFGVDIANLAGTDVPIYVLATAKVMLHIGTVFDTIIYGFIAPNKYHNNRPTAPESIVPVKHPIEITRLPTYSELHQVVSQYQESRVRQKADDSLAWAKVPLD